MTQYSLQQEVCHGSIVCSAAEAVPPVRRDV